MNKKDVKIWTEALRSGRYKKGKFCLHEQKGKSQRFCCLGVAADVLVDADWLPSGIEENDPSSKVANARPDRRLTTIWRMDNDHLELSDNIRNRIGLSHNIMLKLVDFNDGGKGFNWIANWIETNANLLNKDDL